ncbi:hypothetical protein TrVE_jg8816 [Triparma verrucosa]|uniref:Uncharacterized protein n=1 Tax=Triparma verrucosa TaxID=1606542 RepID=A0A9W7KRV9_9STRA|nr:hypothetical protein TrVE_jg8816 [Triparma verrucosa]
MLPKPSSALLIPFSIPFANELKLPPSSLQSHLNLEITRRRNELKTLAFLSLVHKLSRSYLFNSVFKFETYSSQIFANSNEIYATFKTGTKVVPRGVPVTFVISKNTSDVKVRALGCDLMPSLPSDVLPLSPEEFKSFCSEFNEDVAIKRRAVDAIADVVYEKLEPALSKANEFEAFGEIIHFEPRQDLYAREGTSSKWLECVSEYYFAKAKLQEVVPVGCEGPRFVFYWDEMEPINSKNLYININPEVICCIFD